MTPPIIRKGKLVSDTVIFTVKGKKYAGYYHFNGWFYCVEDRENTDVEMAASSRSALDFGSKKNALLVEDWYYLRPQDGGNL